MIVHLTKEAEHDLENIADYIAQNNPKRTSTFVRALREKCLDLANMSQSFPLVPCYEEHGIRRRMHGNYLVFYRLEADRVVVLHILHGAIDYATVVFPDDG